MQTQQKQEKSPFSDDDDDEEEESTKAKVIYNENRPTIKENAARLEDIFKKPNPYAQQTTRKTQAEIDAEREKQEREFEEFEMKKKQSLGGGQQDNFGAKLGGDNSLSVKPMMAQQRKAKK